MNLDYSSLQQAITPTDILQLKQWKKHQKNSRLNVSGTLVSIIVGTLLMVIVVSSAAQHMPPLLAVAIGGGIAVVATGSMLLFQRHQLRKEAVLYRFATANALLLSLDAAPTDHHGVIFTQGHSQRISAAYTAADGTQIGNYRYTTGSGKNRRDHHWKFVRIKLVRRLPHMVLDAKSNNFFGKLSNLPAGFHGQALSLEGNFDNYFTLYAPKEYERDALYVFTPDVMAAVIDLGSAYDMEVIDDSLFLYASGSFRLDQASDLMPLTGLITTIGNKLKNQTDYYSDERTATREANIVAEPGRRLKQGMSPQLLLTIGALAVVFIIYIIRQLMQ